jgi:DUF4097 and DUF4098 domain-containing protein YvlB
MKTFRYFLIGLFILLFVGICVLLLTIIPRGTANWNLTGELTLQNTASYDVSQISQLDIDYGNMPFDITFVLTDEDALRIEESCNKDLSNISTQKVDQNNTTLKIKRSMKWKTFLFSNTKGAITIYLPKYLSQNLQSLAASTIHNIALPDWDKSPSNIALSTVSGSIQAPNLLSDQISLSNVSGDMLLDNISGTLSLSTVSGNLKLGSTAGNATISSVSGDVEIQKANGSLNINTTSGKLQVGEMTGNVNADSTSGKITLTMTSKPSDISLDTTSGNIEIHYPSDASFTFDIGTVSGGIKLPQGSTFTKDADHKKEGSFGTSPSSSISIDGTSSNVDIQISP